MYVRHAQSGRASCLHLDLCYKRLIAVVGGTKDCHVAKGDGLGGYGVSHEESELARHVAKLLETIGGDLNSEFR